MATIRQKKLAKAIVNNLSQEKPLNKKELVVSSGYSEISAESSAHIILEQKGVQEELSALGFDPERAKEIVGQILENSEEDNTRLKAADMIFKVHGTYAAEKHVNLNVDVKTEDSALDAAAKIYGESLRSTKTS